MRLRLTSCSLAAGGIVLSCGWLSASATYESVSLAASFFSKHQFNEGQSVLIKQLGEPDLDNAERAAIWEALGDFYRDDVGDFSGAVNFYQQAEELGYPQKDRLESIRRLKDKYADIDRIIQEIRSRSNWMVNEPDAQEKISTLQAFIAQTPDYYRMAEAHYCIALYHAAGGRNGKALASFKRAESIKPALSFFIPVQNQMKLIQTRWYRWIATCGSKTVFILMFLLSSILFYSSKPWKWLTFKIIRRFFLLLTALCLLFLAAGFLLSALYLKSDGARQLTSAGETYLFSVIYAPGFNLYIKLVLYMVAAFFLTCVFALGTTSLIRRKSISALLNGLAGTLIMASLVCIFYLKHCDQKTLGLPDLTPGSFFSATKALPFSSRGIEPLILTDPEAFLDPGVSHNVNPPLEKWAREHCPFSEKNHPDEL
ncbi:MAG: hypothetical protein MUC65_05030 [Pontiellaceae bacterium]|jgi:tetratricopeptide (TPR) repeat protein|nr:hypothetical protein [Pontiellaceae bacterium]